MLRVPSDCEDGRRGGQRHHGTRLKVKVNHSVCDGADAGAGGGACSHLVLLKSLEITLKGKENAHVEVVSCTVRRNARRKSTFSGTDRRQDVACVAF